MKHAGKALAVLAGGSLILAGTPAVQAVVPVSGGSSGAEGLVAYAAESSIAEVSGVASVADVQGTFSWNQDVVRNNGYLAKVIYKATDYLCAGEMIQPSGTAEVAPNADAKRIQVAGDVNNAFTANLEDCDKADKASKVLGCTCGGNPANGLASANADVEGILVETLIDFAQPREDVNTITFTAADGYRVAFPLSYVQQRYSLIVTEVNGESIEDAFGCANQLWLGTASARTFAQNVVSIELTAEAQVPDVPSAQEFPGIGITAGEAL